MGTDAAQVFVDFIREGGLVALLSWVILGGMRSWYVWAWQYREMERDRNFWRDVAMRTLHLGEKAAGLGEDHSMARRIELLEDELTNLRGR